MFGFKDFEGLVVFFDEYEASVFKAHVKEFHEVKVLSLCGRELSVGGGGFRFKEGWSELFGGGFDI